VQVGGFSLERPALSLSESLVKPTTMLYRNMLVMNVEELLRSHPIDGAVLVADCDKTTPGLVLGALSAGVPFIYMPARPMLRGNVKSKVLGSGSGTWKYWNERRAGKINAMQWREVEGGIAEAIGLTLPGASSIPAIDANHIRIASE
jgi:dihydroxyacid dehydratase/phosphogluconate dehydratase